jgi:RES domain-containing protein
MLPRVATLRQDDTHRLISCKHSEAGASVLVPLADTDDDLANLFELDGATNDRLAGESGLLPGISSYELVFGISYFHIVNAAFTHAHPLGSRFNSSERGAWYAAFELETAEAEVAFHKAQEFQEINWQEEETVSYVDYRADFRAEFHDIRGQSEFANCLALDSYVASQQLAAELLQHGSAGVIYPSVRKLGGTCIACFRPGLVVNVRKGATVNFTFLNAHEPPTVTVEGAE